MPVLIKQTERFNENIAIHLENIDGEPVATFTTNTDRLPVMLHIMGIVGQEPDSTRIHYDGEELPTIGHDPMGHGYDMRIMTRLIDCAIAVMIVIMIICVCLLLHGAF